MPKSKKSALRGPKLEGPKWTITTHLVGNAYGFRLWAYDEHGVGIFLDMSPPAYDSAHNARRGGERRRKELLAALGWEPK